MGQVVLPFGTCSHGNIPFSHILVREAMTRMIITHVKLDLHVNSSHGDKDSLIHENQSCLFGEVMVRKIKWDEKSMNIFTNHSRENS